MESPVVVAALPRAVISPDSDDPTTLDGNGADGVYDRVEHKYNRQRERIWTKNQNGTIREFEYDKLGRRTADKATTLGTDVDNAVRRIERDYEVRGMLEKATNYDAATGGFAVNEVELSYDDFGQPKVEHQEHDGAVDQDTSEVQYAHANGLNNHARLTATTYPNGRVLHHEYSTGDDNNLSRLSYLSDVDANGTRLAEYTYLGAGQIVKVDYPQPDLRYNLAHGAGNDPHDGLDRFGRVVDLLWRDYGSSADAVRIKHGYDRASNRLWRQDTVAAANSVDMDELYTYDGMYQLATLQRGELNANKNGLVAETKTFAEQWTLDPTGNWNNFKQDDDGDDNWDLDQNRTHNKANEIATVAAASTHVAHDRSGNIIRAPKPSDWSSHYHLEYDAWNRLVTVFDADGTTLVAGYNYDALGRRVEKETYSGGSLTEIRHYYYSNQWQVLEEHVQSNYYSGSSSSSLQPPAPSLQYVWGLRYVDDLICRDRDADSNPATGNYGKTGSGLEERLYALQDPNWNVVAIANTSGVIQERYTYTAYGKPTFLTATFGSRASSLYSWTDLFTGRQYDVETGFLYSRWRYFHTLLGRWLNRDPIGYRGGDRNLYRYVRNNPIIYVDPSGLTAAGDQFKKLCTSKCVAKAGSGCTVAQCKKEAEEIGKAYEEMFEDNKTWRIRPGDYSAGWMCYQWQTKTHNALKDTIEKSKCFSEARVGHVDPSKSKPLRHSWVAITVGKGQTGVKAPRSGPCTAWADPWAEGAANIYVLDPKTGKYNRPILNDPDDANFLVDERAMTHPDMSGKLPHGPIDKPNSVEGWWWDENGVPHTKEYIGWSW